MLSQQTKETAHGKSYVKWHDTHLDQLSTPQIMHRYVNSLMSILPGSNKPKRHIGPPYPVSEFA